MHVCEQLQSSGPTRKPCRVSSGFECIGREVFGQDHENLHIICRRFKITH